MKLGPHFCSKMHRLKSPGKVRKHFRRCKTCKELLAVERDRRVAAGQLEVPRGG